VRTPATHGRHERRRRFEIRPACFEQIGTDRRHRRAQRYRRFVTRTYRLPSSVHVVHDRDGAVLLDKERGLVYGLNATAGLILQRLQAGHDLPEIERDLRQAFSNIEGEPHDDIVALIDQLVRAGLLVASSPDARG
jgi:Coenzyme PQQ synthesis protein D (PqqD)